MYHKALLRQTPSEYHTQIFSDKEFLSLTAPRAPNFVVEAGWDISLTDCNLIVNLEYCCQPCSGQNYKPPHQLQTIRNRGAQQALPDIKKLAPVAAGRVHTLERIQVKFVIRVYRLLGVPKLDHVIL